MLGLALAFPVALMIFNPTLMFERGWEQYVGTSIYLWAVLTLAFELARTWKNERAFAEAPAWLSRDDPQTPEAGFAPAVPIAEDDRRVLAARIRQLSCHGAASSSQLMELNREASGLDQEQAAGRFTLTRYILYLLPVIGFIGTVEGISKALMNISLVLPMVKDLDGFMSNLTGVTSALQIAFDSTLLALFLSAALMLVQTLVYRRSEDLLARVDRWVVEHVLPGSGTEDATALKVSEAVATHLERLRVDLLGELGPHLDRFAEAVDRLPAAMAGFQRGADAIGRIGSDLEAIGTASDSLRRGVATLGRIENTLSVENAPGEHLDEIKRGIDRTCAAIETLSDSWTQAQERSSRASQDQLARTLYSLKEALDLLNVSMEQGHSLYRTIVKKMFNDRNNDSDAARAA
jgi:biopolymer transport protein ExbB/TolQ